EDRSMAIQIIGGDPANRSETVQIVTKNVGAKNTTLCSLNNRYQTVSETNFVGGPLSKLSWKLHRHVLNQTNSSFLRRLFGSNQARNIDFPQYRRELDGLKNQMSVYAHNVPNELRPDFEQVLSGSK